MILSPTARNEMILAHLWLVKAIACRFSRVLPRTVEINDLVSVGIIGLIDAIEKFDPERQIKFKTYAEYRIKGAMIDELRSLDWISRPQRDMLNKMKNLYAEFGMDTSDEKIQELMGITREKFLDLIYTRKQSVEPMSLDLVIELSREGSCTPNDWLDDPTNISPGTIMDRERFEIAVGRAIDSLAAKERMVISLYYYEGLNMREIGDVLNVGEARISQIHTKAIAHLRAAMEANTIIMELKEAMA